MNIYLISQEESTGYDTYDSAIVYANSEKEARLIHPGIGWGERWTGWASSPDQVVVSYLGTTNLEVSSGIILSSFNAG